jgi:hypothetical protein
VDRAPPPSPAGTTRVVVESVHIDGVTDDIEADEVADDDAATDVDDVAGG